MSRRRIAVALLFTAAGITPLAAVPLAWGGQGFTASTTVSIDGRTADTFPVTASATTAPVAVPQVIQPPTVVAPVESAPVVESAPTAATSSKAPKPSRTTRTAKPSTPPAAQPSTSETTGN